MTATDILSLTAVTVSLAAMLGCFIIFPVIYQKGISIQDELTLGLEEFKVVAEQAWMKIQKKKSSPAHDSLKTRKARQYGYYRAYGWRSLYNANYQTNDYAVSSGDNQGLCQCDERNTCPPGPAGAPGQSGSDGERGQPGKSGIKGAPGILPRDFVRTMPTGCHKCPPGPKGPSGSPGNSGRPGEKGGPGNQGGLGRPGFLGRSGQNSSPGQPGRDGAPGHQGAPGRSAECYRKGNPGNAGRPGADGQRGQPGPGGNRSQPGRPGPQGGPGPNGNDGQPGPHGPLGKPGKPGKPGKDAQYCPCPRKSYRHLQLN